MHATSCMRRRSGAGAPAHLAEVARVVVVKHDAVVVLSTGVTASTRMLAVLANAAMAGTDVPALLAVLPEACAQERRLSAAAPRPHLPGLPPCISMLPQQ